MKDCGPPTGRVRELTQGVQYKPFLPPPRNTRAGLAERAIKNLETIMRAYEVGEDVHVVTQVILSLQAIVVFPLESQSFQEIQRRPLSDVTELWKIKTDTYKDKCVTWGSLIRHVRNAISHRRLLFSSDSRLLKEVTIEFTDIFGDKKKGIQSRWVAEIRGDCLYTFCHYLLPFLRDVQS